MKVVVVVSLFEPVEDTDDVPGEYQFRVQREKLDRVRPFPPGYRDLRANADGKGDNLAAMTYWSSRGPPSRERDCRRDSARLTAGEAGYRVGFFQFAI